MRKKLSQKGLQVCHINICDALVRENDGAYQEEYVHPDGILSMQLSPDLTTIFITLLRCLKILLERTQQ